MPKVPAPAATADLSTPPCRTSGGAPHGPWGRWGGRPRHGGRGRNRHRHLRGPVRRTGDSRVLAGVCGGLAAATGIDVTLVRIAFILLALGSGVGVLVYALAWLLVPLEGEATNIFARVVADRRGIRLVIAILPALVVVQLVAGTLRIGFVGSFTWPLFLAAGAALLVWRNASEREKAWINDDLVPLLHTGAERGRRWSLVGRVITAVVLGIAGLLVLVLGHTTGAALRPIGGAVLVVAAVVVAFGPWWLGLARDLLSERQARALAEERSEMAAHVHDSVLQTLALIQRSADDPQHVIRLARAQERDLRSWLFEGRPPGSIGEEASMLSEGINLIQHQVEADHGITVQVVVVGDCPLTDGLRALLDASREATVNAAKWSGAPEVSVYAEVDRDDVMLFVRDRGRGFEPESVPGDRKGIAHSIRGRMARSGGSVVIHSSPDHGTEIELSMPRREPIK